MRKGASTAKTAAQRLARRERALRRDGSAAERADGEPNKHDKCTKEKCGEGEPVDVATGEMFMSATDVSLPGALPLVLERHYVSTTGRPISSSSGTPRKNARSNCTGDDAADPCVPSSPS
ncbi:DUF6531 domain-containing protein [Streptomyces sp. NPDC002785]|uniref:DUF6531 domain-containing protein n=1 Tax=Streptomyces sp. NPDC002785 TaxID=3154543 RepID=UPI003316DCCD